MRKTPELLEKRRLGEIAREYEKRGYTVLLEPKGSDLPEFLRGLRPDLIARNVEESVVVEVKSQASLVRDAQLARLTEVVSSRPGWRLELVVTNPMKSLLSDTYRVLDDSQIRARLQEARALADAGSRPAAMLVLWSAAEAVLRRIAQEESVRLEVDSPGHLLKQLAVSGCISQSEYEVLRSGIEARNALVHGFDAPQVSQQLIDQIADVVQGLAGESVGAR